MLQNKVCIAQCVFTWFSLVPEVNAQHPVDYLSKPFIFHIMHLNKGGKSSNHKQKCILVTRLFNGLKNKRGRICSHWSPSQSRITKSERKYKTLIYVPHWSVQYCCRVCTSCRYSCIRPVCVQASCIWTSRVGSLIFIHGRELMTGGQSHELHLPADLTYCLATTIDSNWIQL